MTGSPKRSALYSILIHAAVIALVLLATGGNHPPIGIVFEGMHDAVFLPSSHTAGGGGGQRDKTQASRGILPPRARRVFVAPVNRIVNTDPVLPMAPAILVPDDAPQTAIDLSAFGDPHGVAGPVSGGPGNGYGIGDGDGNGVGRRQGPGYGDGDGPGITGDGRFVGSLTAPVLLWKMEPAYADEARKAKIQGTVVLYVEIDAGGHARNIRVRQSVGFGLDERAIEAVERWRFRPAYRNGKPVPAGALVEVNFRLL